MSKTYRIYFRTPTMRLIYGALEGMDIRDIRKKSVKQQTYLTGDIVTDNPKTAKEYESALSAQFEGEGYSLLGVEESQS